MIDYQAKILERLRRYTNEAEKAMTEERWGDAQTALLGVALAQDELRRTMPNPIADTGFTGFG